MRELSPRRALEAVAALPVALALFVVATSSCDQGAGGGPAGPGDGGGGDADANGDPAWACPASAVDAEVGACRAPLPAHPADCAGTWAEQKARGCKPGVVVFVSAEDPSVRQWIWFERPWLSGGLSCFFDAATGLLAGFWAVKDQPFYCCATSFDVTYGDVDQDLHEATSRAAGPWVGRFYDVDGTASVEGGEVRYCASPPSAAPAGDRGTWD